MINGGVFNSPFALYPVGTPEFRDAYTLGFTVFGPLMYEYLRWLHETTREDAKLAFLAREGFIFQKVYEAMMGNHAKEHLYLLASRRSISVAAIRSKEDILEICRRDYDGDLRNLLRSRLGAPEEMIAKFPERYVHFKEGAVDDEYERTMKLLEPYFDQIIAYGAVERENYLKYFESQIPAKDRERTVYVDIGYAGTIQYFLSKLLDSPVTGAYMAVFKEHPGLAARNCKVLAMYRGEGAAGAGYGEGAGHGEGAGYGEGAGHGVGAGHGAGAGHGEGAEFAATLEKTQLFLESVLQAPYGQLLHFTDYGPVYKEEALPGEQIEKLQEGIIDYARLRGHFSKRDKEDISAQRKYMERMYEHFLSGPYIGEDVGAMFTVEDTYSQDATLHYDGKSKKWKI